MIYLIIFLGHSCVNENLVNKLQMLRIYNTSWNDVFEIAAYSYLVVYLNYSINSA